MPTGEALPAELQSRLLEFKRSQKLEASFVELQLIEINHAKIVSDFVIGRRHLGCTLKVADRQGVITSACRQLPKAVIPFSTQAGA